MRITDRYILFEFLKSMLILLSSFIILFMVFDLAINIGRFINSGIPGLDIFLYYMLKIPTLLDNGIPMVLLLATFWSMNRLNRNHEIMAMQASGISVLRICAPLFGLSFLLAVLSFQINEQINTKTSSEVNRIDRLLEGKKTDEYLERQFFFTDISGSSLAFQRYYPNTETMTGIKWDAYSADEKLIAKIFADRAEYIGGSWWLYDLNMIRFRGDVEEHRPKLKRRRMYEWTFSPGEISNRQDFTNLRTNRLKRRIAKYDTLDPLVSRFMRIELHNRFAMPVMNIVALLLALPFAFRIQATKSVMAGIGISFLLVFAYYGIYTISVIIGNKGVLVPYIVWVPNFLFTAIGIMLFKILR